MHEGNFTEGNKGNEEPTEGFAQVESHALVNVVHCRALEITGEQPVASLGLRGPSQCVRLWFSVPEWSGRVVPVAPSLNPGRQSPALRASEPPGGATHLRRANLPNCAGRNIRGTRLSWRTSLAGPPRRRARLARPGRVPPAFASHHLRSRRGPVRSRRG